MRKTLLAAALALMAGAAFAAPNPNENDVGVYIIDPMTVATGGCEAGRSLQDLKDAAKEADMEYVILQDEALEKFAKAVKEKYGIDKPDRIDGLVIPNFYKLKSDPVMIAQLDANECYTDQSTWDAEFMKSVIPEEDFKAAE